VNREDRNGEGSDATGRDASEEGTERPVVLVVDDEEVTTEAVALWLGDDYEVLTAYSGEAALETLDGRVDVVLLDRHMPGLSGSETLERIRERDLGVRVAMLTAVDPELGVAEMPFDAYLVKPVDDGSLHETVDRLCRLADFDDAVGDLYAVAQKRALLEAEHAPGTLEGSEEYRTLVEEHERLRDETRDAAAGMDWTGFERLVGDL
jgi:DNA-binding response OmpR family regulator